ncbi:translation initiation factor IF-3 [Candidatus Gracilibacteria bacterium]|nr:translation initiation factor IF-3 [Candidatus Gracilibacteria bacterium]
MTNYRRRRAKPKPIGPNYQVNQYIRAEEVRLLDEEGSMLGVYKVSEALRMANEKEFDLIEINPKAQPPIVKMMDYNKFKYQISKSSQNKKTSNDMKTVRVSVRVSPHDLAVRARQIEKVFGKRTQSKNAGSDAWSGETTPGSCGGSYEKFCANDRDSIRLGKGAK